MTKLASPLLSELPRGAHSPAPRIDAHQHFWHYTPDEYGWIDGEMTALQRDRLPQHLAPELAAAGVDCVVSVQARQTLAETDWLLQLSDEFPWICGVVGWGPITSPTFSHELDRLRSHSKLKGLRHVVQAEPDPCFLLRDPFTRGIRTLQETGLVYDLLIVEHQLPQAIRFVDLHPNQVFVLDHIAKPCIAGRAPDPWRANLRELARRDHVYCKLSGMVTEAAWDCWKPEDLLPYADVALEAFGAQRIMAGSDWPVCTVATTYLEWTTTLQLLLHSLSAEEQARVFGGTAIEAYRLEPCLTHPPSITA